MSGILGAAEKIASAAPSWWGRMQFWSSRRGDFTTRVRTCCELLPPMCTSPSGSPGRHWWLSMCCWAGGPETAPAQSGRGQSKSRPLCRPSRVQKIADLGEQFRLARRLRRLGRLRGLRLLQLGQSSNRKEQDSRDEQEIDDDGEEVAPSQHGPLLLGVRQCRGGDLQRQGDEIVREVEPAGDRADDRHDDVADERTHDGAECRSDDHANGEIDHVAAQGKLLEILEHGLFPPERIKGYVRSAISSSDAKSPRLASWRASSTSAT